MSEKIRLDRKIGFRNTFCTKCINVIIDSIGPSIILRSIFNILFLFLSKGDILYFFTHLINSKLISELVSNGNTVFLPINAA